MNEGLHASSQGGFFRVLIDQADFFFRLAKDEIPNAGYINKFGHNEDVSTATTPEDMWHIGGLWVPPTQARIHNLTSTEVNDTILGSGARTVKVTGLTAWDLLPVTEIVEMDGQGDVPTDNAYVIIYRMEVLTFGALAENEGLITATAVTDATITASIEENHGQTMMAIFGIPAQQSLQLLSYYIGWSRTGGASNNAGVTLRVNQRPDQADGGFVAKHHLGLFGAGNTYIQHKFKPYFVIEGPAIVKVQIDDVSANNTDLTAGFDGIIVTN
jgi:hypothetical protein